MKKESLATGCQETPFWSGENRNRNYPGPFDTGGGCSRKRFRRDFYALRRWSQVRLTISTTKDRCGSYNSASHAAILVA